MTEGLFDPAKVDLVGETKDGVVELFVVQDRPWTGSDTQLGSLQQKIHNYVAYALDGPMVDSYPQTAGRPWRIVVHSQVGELDDRTRLMLEALREPLLRYGASLAVRTGGAAEGTAPGSAQRAMRVRWRSTRHSAVALNAA